LYSQIVGFDSTYEGTAGVESEYDSYLTVHQQPPQNLSQAIGLSKVPENADSVTLTIDPKLQQAAQTALSTLRGANTDAAVVAIEPKTGAILADYSTPNFDPAPLEAPNSVAGTNQQELAALTYFKTPDKEGFYSGQPLATGVTFPPGSTFKVVTSSTAYNLDPSQIGFYFKPSATTTFPNSTLVMKNDDGDGDICGGTMADDMFATSCDPGYGQLGVKLGAANVVKQAQLFGYESKPPVDLPSAWVATPTLFAPGGSESSIAPPNQAYLAYTSIGQYNDRASALSNALIAAGIANGGAIMTPHVMERIDNSQGESVDTYKPTVWKQAVSSTAAAQLTSLMKSVITNPYGTAAGVGFPADLDAAVKTGTAQTQIDNQTDDWMIGFAPANDPQIAIAVVVPLQPVNESGADLAGPIVKDMFEAYLGETGSQG
jgi:peptidoglycan glycosyltransferase